MESPTITLELPVTLYTNLQALARQERINLPELLTRLLQTAYQETATTTPRASAPVIQALLRTGRVQHLLTTAQETAPALSRQTPPTLSGVPVSELLIAQRRGEL